MFITLAEETGSIVPIGAWVFETALAQLKAWETRWPEQARDLWLSVNLSTRQLAEPSLPESLAGIVQRTGVDPGRVLVEVTESVLVADAEAAARRLAALRALGLRVAIDDFGTGYSSLGVLEQMPVDVLKIAARFVERLGTDEHRPRLVEALVRLGDTLNLPTVAEGIENVTQLTVLQLLGCEMGQGFYLSRPLRVDRVEGRRWFLEAEMIHAGARLAVAHGVFIERRPDHFHSHQLWLQSQDPAGGPADPQA